MSEMSNFQKNDHDNDGIGHEVDRVNVGTVVRVGAGLATMVIVSMIGMVYLFRGLDAVVEVKLPTYASPAEELTPPPPRVSPDQAKQRRELRAEHRRILTSYGWVDQEAGIARIPIDRAIELVANELAARESVE